MKDKKHIVYHHNMFGPSCGVASVNCKNNFKIYCHKEHKICIPTQCNMCSHFGGEEIGKGKCCVWEESDIKGEEHAVQQDEAYLEFQRVEKPKIYEKMTQFHTHPFDPVFDQNSRILILGSFPSVRSREEGFYYGHPRNRFWRLLAICLDEAVPESTDEKRHMLFKHKIALWDVLSSCQISGSADSSIRSAEPNDLRTILDCAPVERILCNGAAAGKLCVRYCKNIMKCDPVILPSTSPANAAWSLDRLYTAWKEYLKIE